MLKQVDNSKSWYARAAIVAAAAVALAALFMIRENGPQAWRTSTVPRLVAQNAKPAPTVARPTRRPSQVLSPSGALAVAAPEKWVARFRSSDDYSNFVDEALPAALQGDGRAAWYIAQALTSCSLTMKLYAGSPDPQAQLRHELDGMAAAPQWSRDLIEQRTRRCLGLVARDPFRSLPAREGGYPSAYWFEKAVEDGEPLALERDAANTFQKILSAPEIPEKDRTVQLADASSKLRTALRSGDPDVLYNAGMLFSDRRLTRTPENAIAVVLAACNLGSDCTSDNPESVLYNCRFSGQCASGNDYATVIQHDLGPATYARVYSRAQQIEQSVVAGDWDAVAESLTADNLREQTRE